MNLRAGAMVLLASPWVLGQGDPMIRVRTSARHPMPYALSLPKGWCTQRTWPVVVVIPDAERDFQGNLAAFVRARGERPFILVAPFVVTSGGSGFRETANFQYEVAVWREVDRAGDFGFDQEGIQAVLEEVRQRFRGEEKAYLTGWEAGGHTVWPLLFRNPERWAAVAPVSTNWAGRWMGPGDWSTSPARAQVPVQVFFVGPQPGLPETARLAWYHQTQQALGLAQVHGFQPLPIRMLRQQPHGPLAEPVLAWFQSLRQP